MFFCFFVALLQFIQKHLDLTVSQPLTAKESLTIDEHEIPCPTFEINKLVISTHCSLFECPLVNFFQLKEFYLDVASQYIVLNWA